MAPVKVTPNEIEKIKQILEEQLKAFDSLEERTAKYGMLDTPLKLQEDLSKRETEIERLKSIIELDLQRFEIQKKYLQLELKNEAQKMRRRTTFITSSILAFIGITIGVAVNLVSDSLTNKLGFDINFGILLGVISGLLSIIATFWTFSKHREVQERDVIEKIINNQKIITGKEANNPTIAAKGEIS